MRRFKKDDPDELNEESHHILKMSKSELPSASDLLSLDPIKHGWMDKKRSSIISTLFFCCINQWKKRYFILIGNFIFRYASPRSEKPKGAPIPLDAATISIGDDGTTIEIFTIRKFYVFRASSHEQCMSWINEIQKRKQVAIKEGLGHIPIKSNIEFVNRVGANMIDERLRRDRDPVINPLADFTNVSIPNNRY